MYNELIFQSNSDLTEKIKKGDLRPGDLDLFTAGVLYNILKWKCE